MRYLSLLLILFILPLPLIAEDLFNPILDRNAYIDSSSADAELVEGKVPLYKEPWPAHKETSCLLNHGDVIVILDYRLPSNYYRQVKVKKQSCVGWVSHIYLNYHNPRTTSKPNIDKLLEQAKNSEQSPSPPKHNYNISLYLNGCDRNANPPLTRMIIPIYSGPYPNRSAIACWLPHGTQVEILDKQLSGSYYVQYKIESGSCIGWVSNIYLSVDYNEPIGDRIYR